MRSNRFAGKNRTHGVRDNNFILSTGNSVATNFRVPPNLPGSRTQAADLPGAQFFESSLPYERVITSVRATRLLPGPQTHPPFINNTGFLVNQAFETVAPGADHPPNYDIDVAEAWTKQAEQPLPFVDPAHPGDTAESGSGGNFLSNEIFYRTARLRSTNRPALPSGHLHIPKLGDPFGNEPKLGPGLLKAVEHALEEFLKDKLQLRSLGDVAFPDTVITRSSAPLILKAQNETNAVVEVASVNYFDNLPQIFVLQTPLPAQASPGGVLELSYIFKPTTTITYASIARVKDAAGKILFSAQLRGKGLAVPPSPVITRFEPASGEIGDPITILGSNLANATEVRIGGGLVLVVSNTDTQIEAMVSVTARTGTVSVKTLSGTATTTDRFTVIRHRHHEPLSAQLIARRAELGLSASEGAAQVGAKPGTYRRWESGEDRPSARFQSGIASFLGHNPNPDPAVFGEIIRATREREGLTRSQLAERLGLASSTIRTWEEGAVSRPSTRVSSIFEEYVREE